MPGWSASDLRRITLVHRRKSIFLEPQIACSRQGNPLETAETEIIMANYFIIGGDDKEYGPVSDADVRLWIAEGRLSAASRAKAENDAEFRTLAQFPEFAAALAPQAAPATIAPVRTATDFLERDYELDLGGCISRGWELLKGNFATIFVSFLIMILVEMACAGALNLVTLAFVKGLLHAPIVLRIGYNYFFTAVLSLVMGPLMGGLFLVYLKTIRRQATSIGEVFAGFQTAFGQLFLGALVVSLIVNACMLPFNFVWQTKAGPLLEQMQQMQSDPTGMQNLLPQLVSAFTGALPVLFVCLIPVTFLTVSWQFTLPLIIDKQMNFGTAMKTSFKMVGKHWWQVFGLTILVGLVSFAGVLGCCIGVLFTAPIGIAGMMFAYETIFGAEKN
jgi:hypothetical protein